MKNAALKWLGMLAWGLTSLVAINEGLKPFIPGYDVFQSEFAMMNPQIMKVACAVILVSGLYSFALFCMAAAGHCGCSSCGGSC